MTLSLDEAELLHRLRERDPVATARFCERYLQLLRDDRRWVSGLTRDEHMIEDAAIDAVFAFVQRPEVYDPRRSGITSYLRMAAKGDLRNALAREQRHASRRAPLEVVDLQPFGGNEEQEGPDLPGVTREELLQRLRRELPEPRDQEAMVLIMEGVRDSAAFARLYGLVDLPSEELKRAVKQHKDRIKQRARRLGIRLRHE